MATNSAILERTPILGERNMHRREFLAASAATVSSAALAQARLASAEPAVCSCDRTFASPAEAIKSPREELAYVVGTYAGTKSKAPDFLATIDLDPASPTYSQVIHRLPMPTAGDELHHFGWNACGSCQNQQAALYEPQRRQLFPDLRRYGFAGSLRVEDRFAAGGD